MTREPRILFTSWHSLVDPGSGAAISAWELLDALPRMNWKVRSLSGPLLDGGPRFEIEQILSDKRIPFQTERLQVRETPFKMVGYRTETITGLSFVPEKYTYEPEPDLVAAFVKIFMDLIDQWKPDVLLTYGGHAFMPKLFRYAQSQGVKTVFLLANLAYRSKDLFLAIDAVVVPSDFSKNHYKNKIDLACTVIPCLMKPEMVLANSPPEDRRYVTFINPQPHKGVFLFTQIARILAKLRPEIPLLVIEGRGGASFLGSTGIDMSEVRNISIMPNTPHPIDYYDKSRIVLMPSLCEETFGRVAAEAMMGGIPVLASNRGSLPEICGDAGLVLDVPEKYTPESRITVTEKDANPWVEAIIRLWDDEKYYAATAEKSREHSTQWNYETVLARYDQLLHD